MAALKWFVHTACNVLGYPSKEEQANIINGDVKSLKVPSPTNNVGLSYINSEAGFQMPLHYPRYTKEDYEKMEEWKLDLLLNQYGLSFKGSLLEKREYAIGAFLWPDQY